MRRSASLSVLALSCILAFAGEGFGVTELTPSPTPRASPTPEYSTGNFLKDIVRDQKAIWTAPFHAKRDDLKWVVPAGAIATGLLATDSRSSRAVPSTGHWPTVSKAISNAGNAYATAGVSAGMYALGKAIKNDKLRDTGRMASEALIDATVVAQAFKYSFGRLRPYQDGGRGRFFEGGRSFFSGHSSSTFAIAAVVACQHKNKPLIRYGALAAASAIALSRYTGRNHFLGDIFVGSAVGYGIGSYVCENRQSKPTAATGVDPNKFSWRPAFQPYVDRRIAVYGGSLAWHF